MTPNLCTIIDTGAPVTRVEAVSMLYRMGHALPYLAPAPDAIVEACRLILLAADYAGDCFAIRSGGVELNQVAIIETLREGCGLHADGQRHDPDVAPWEVDEWDCQHTRDSILAILGLLSMHGGAL